MLCEKSPESRKCEEQSIPLNSKAVRARITPYFLRSLSSGYSAKSKAVNILSRSSFGPRRRPTPQTSPTGIFFRISPFFSGITKTPPSLFFPMWFAIFARVLVGAKPIPHGIPIFFSIRARAANAYSYMSDLLGGKTKASSIEYCSISPNTSPSTHISRFDMSAYSSKLLDFRMTPSCRTRGRN